ncbi:MAG TPA: hypothetical protein VGL22_04475 [Terracidiphilus sp.]|jgi:hypothetical protein
MKIRSTALSAAFALAALLGTAAIPAFAAKYETIDATAGGTSTQLGRMGTIRLIIYEYSQADDRQILVEAFQHGQNDGLANALEKMKAVGRITIPGTLGFDVSYIRVVKTPTGRSIRFITNRKIAFGEHYWDSQSKSFNLTAGEINIDDQDKKKSGGVLFPATQLNVNKDGELQWDLRQNKWTLSNVIVWPGDSTKEK